MCHGNMGEGFCSHVFQGISGKAQWGQYRHTGVILRTGRPNMSSLFIWDPYSSILRGTAVNSDIFFFFLVRRRICKISAMSVFLLMHQKRYQKAYCRVMERDIKHKEFGWSVSFVVLLSPLQLLREKISPHPLLISPISSGCIKVSGRVTCQDSCRQWERTEPRTRFVRAEKQGFSIANPVRGAPPSLRLAWGTRGWLQSSSHSQKWNPASVLGVLFLF